SVQIAARLPIQGPGIAGTAAVEVVLGQLLTNAYGLKVHAEYLWNSRAWAPIVTEASNLIENRRNLQVIVLNRADNAHRGIESWRIRNFGSVEIVDSLAGWPVHPIVSRVLIGPGGVAARRFYHLENCIGPKRIMGPQWSAGTM